MNTTPNFDVLIGRGRKAQSVAAGNTIFREGDATGPMYALRSGKVEIKVKGVVVDTIGPGGMFGEMSMIERAPRTATATAVADSEIIAVDEEGFLALVQQTPYFALNVMRSLAKRVRAMNAKMS